MNVAISLGDVLTRPDVWRGIALAGAALPGVPSGFAGLDAELPGGGWPRGALTEILCDGAGLGECALLLPALGRIDADGKWALLVAPPHACHAPAWAACGANLAHLALVAPARTQDALWAAEQALSGGALGMVLCWAPHVDARQVRRLQTAAAAGSTLAFLFRAGRARGEASAAALRLQLSAGPRGTLSVALLKRRGPPCAHTLHLDVPRPLKWREAYEHASTESPLARPPSAVPAAGSPRLRIPA